MRSCYAGCMIKDAIFAIIIAIYVTLGVEIATRLWASLP
jgi:hypothetical protein